ncbi:hypothetical protein C2845_PM06G21570 [Panicum miliaceum]|uniref:Uncharacterized protein n=1 Tax=Panicum miliaceum TaxID=4540 RepID=A0A3L6R794_PANMI|nr:hypothetical protein C2845_PM06G21570 [Panicum miliaceum]
MSTVFPPLRIGRSTATFPLIDIGKHLAKNLLEELECLVDDVYGITLTANLRALKVSDSHSIKNKLTTESCIIGVEVSVPIFPFTSPLHSVFFSTEDKSADQLDSDVLLVTVMVIVRNMLKLDYTMQEIIVGALSLNMLPSELEGYRLMWDLRPYIDDDMMHLAWEMCP